MVSHTVCIAQAVGVAIIVSRILICAKWDKLEAVGTSIVLGGACVLMSDTSSEKTSGETQILAGDLVAFCSLAAFATNIVLYDVIIRRSNVFAVIQVSSVFTVVNFCLF